MQHNRIYRFNLTSDGAKALKGDFVMEKMREEWKKQRRENRSKKRIEAAKERRLDSKNSFGITDPTPQQAVINIIEAASKNNR